MISKKNELFEQIRTILEFFRKYWVWITAVIVCLTMTELCMRRSAYRKYITPRPEYMSGHIPADEGICQKVFRLVKT